jgi:hypothetical protein
VLQSKLNPQHVVILTAEGGLLSTDGGATADFAFTAGGVIAEKVIGVLGNFITIEIGIGNNVFKSDQNGIYLGHQTFANAPFRVNMAGKLNASNIDVTGIIHATGGTFSGGIVATGTITGGILIGALIQTSSSYPRVELSSSGNLIQAYYDANRFVSINPAFIADTPLLRFVDSTRSLTASLRLDNVSNRFVIQTIGGNILLDPGSFGSVTLGGAVYVPSWSALRNSATSDSLQTALDTKIRAGGGADIMMQWFDNYLEVFVGGTYKGRVNLVA